MDGDNELQINNREANTNFATDPKRSWTDSAIRSEAEDEFDFKDYAKILSSRIMEADPPLTIGIFGSWGSGKTSLMNLIEEVLSLKARSTKVSKKEVQEIETIWINVWQLSNQEEVWQAFLQALFNEVNRKFPRWKRIQWWKLGRELLVNSYRIVVVIIPIIIGGLIGKPDASWIDVINTLTNPIESTPIGSLTSLGLALWLLVKPAVEASRDVVDIDLKSVLKYGSYKDQITELMKLQRDFANMVADLVGEDGRLVVFIDDLDRCTPDKIPDLLEAIKLFTTTPKCVYVLGLDHDIVRQGIFKKYQFKYEREAAEYLEKIVQVPFHLPPLDEGKIEGFVQEYYPEIHERCPTAAEVFSKGLEPNPRKVKRALNIYRTLLELADNRVEIEIMEPIKDELLAKLVVIQSRSRRLYDEIVRHPTFLTDLQPKVEKQLNVNDLRELIEKHEKEYQIKNKLVEDKDLQALWDMLNAGAEHFPLQPWRIRDYIYLTSTAEDTAWLTNITPEEAVPYLLSNDQDLIQDAVRAVIKDKSNGEKENTIWTLVQSLWPTYESPVKQSDRESAGYALVLLRQDFEPEMVPILPEKCVIGSTDEEIIKLTGDDFERFVITEKPKKELEVPEYFIGKYPITNSQYLKFVEDRGVSHPVPRTWKDGRVPQGMEEHPVVDVSWHDAMDYCQW